MARQPRIEYAGAIYHVMNRGDRRERIMQGPDDGKLFVDTLEEACVKTGWQVHAFCLMPNHFHLVIETPQANLVYGMKWFLGTYTGRFNRRHELYGHLFSGRYKSLVVDDRDAGYLHTVCQYVHLNPARAGLIKKTERLAHFRLSSFPEYLKPPSKRKRWIRSDRLLGELGIGKDSTSGRRRFEELTERHRHAENPEDYDQIRRGWCLGSEGFRDRCRSLLAESLGDEHYGAERQESQETHANHLIKTHLKRLKLKERDLADRAKGDEVKVELAVLLRRETVMSFSWIAARLGMGSRSYAQNLVYAALKGSQE